MYSSSVPGNYACISLDMLDDHSLASACHRASTLGKGRSGLVIRKEGMSWICNGKILL